MSALYSSTFTFVPGDFDQDFHALDAEIAQAARAIAGYVGEESWEQPATGQVSNVYYWDSLSALEQLMNHPAHLKAKQLQARWLKGYHVVIAQVLRSHGDGRMAHPLSAKGPV